MLVAAAILALAAALFLIAGPRIGRVLAFTVMTAKDDGPSKAWEIIAEVDPAAGTSDDFAATAVAVASAVPADAVVVTLERNDIPPSAGSWRRTLARAEYRAKDDPAWTVSTAEPPLTKAEVSAAMEYTERVGLGLTQDGEAMPAEVDAALVAELAAKHRVAPQRVKTFTPLYRERGPWWGWLTLNGPGSERVVALTGCFAARREGEAWKACR